jgi:hypothetical protein
MSTPGPRSSAPSLTGARVRTAGSVLLGNVGKVIGLYLLYMEGTGKARVPVMAIYLSLAFGAQFAENVLLKAIEQMFSTKG